MNIFGLREKERQFMNPKIRKAKEKNLDKEDKDDILKSKVQKLIYFKKILYST